MFYETQDEIGESALSDQQVVKTFIRIPKSGSTSFAASLSRAIPNYDPRHLTVKDILADGQERKFYCFVRDPLQQYISMYYYAKNLPTSPISDDKYKIMDAFMEHINVVQQTKSLSDYLMHAPQNAFLGKYLSGLDPSELACVGRLDRFDESLVLISKIVGIPVVNTWLKKGSYTAEDLSFGIVDKFMSNNELEYGLYRKSLEHYDKLKNIHL